jgi:ATP-dependent RNA helicase RhlE
MYKRSHMSRNSRFTPNRRNGPPVKTIHESHFIKKAAPVVPSESFVPKTRFNDLPINSLLKNNIAGRGFAIPTPIQDVAISPILEGRDVIGIANTGTGKTGAFLIPIIEKLMKQHTEKALIVVPTRELGLQIREELRLLAIGTGIYSSICIGGTNMNMQMQELRKNPQIVIGTPGRLIDLIKRKTLHLSTFNTVVLDEVDRMVDMGFIQDVRYLVALLPTNRQSLFFSATISPNINVIIQSFLRDPLTVSVKSGTTSANVEQNIIRVQSNEYKINVLENLLKKEEFKKVLIFGRTKRGVDKLSTSLYQKGFKVGSIHGNKPQSKRQQAIRLFKEGVVKVLVATDVAARGIDIPNITHVINYDQPATYDDYVHRIGRTGRGEQKGIALTFV